MNIDLYTAKLAGQREYIKANSAYFQENDVYENTAMLISCINLFTACRGSYRRESLQLFVNEVREFTVILQPFLNYHDFRNLNRAYDNFKFFVKDNYAGEYGELLIPSVVQQYVKSEHRPVHDSRAMTSCLIANFADRVDFSEKKTEGDKTYATVRNDTVLKLRDNFGVIKIILIIIAVLLVILMLLILLVYLPLILFF